jgi:hypothetical protein
MKEESYEKLEKVEIAKVRGRAPAATEKNQKED